MNNTKSYEYVLAIAETSSISDAAERLGIAQPALSRYLSNLEKKLGVELFDRRALPILLTEAGRYYVDAGRQMLDINRQLEKRLEDIKLNRNYEVRVGVGPSRAPVLLPLILREFSGQCPHVRVLTDECRTAELAERLSDGKLDLIITFLDRSTDSFEMEDLFEEKVALAVPPNYQCEIQKAMCGGEVDVSRISTPFISLHEGQQLRNALDILTNGRVKPLYDSDYLESAMALVHHGLGVTLAPSYWRLIERDRNLRYYPIVIPPELTADERNHLMSIINRRIGIFYRKKQFLSDAERMYIKAAHKVCASI